MKKYVISVFGDGVDEALKGVQERKRWLLRKSNELSKRLADMGATYASFDFDHAPYSGDTSYTMDVKRTGENTYTVTANGAAVLFIEFGAGITHGYGHPEPQNFGPGTYPGQTHAMTGKGWWYETNDASKATKTSKKSGKSWVHTYGNPPSAPMYNAVKSLKDELKQVVQEVFAD